MTAHKVVISKKIDYKYEKEGFYIFAEGKILRLSSRVTDVLMKALKGELTIYEHSEYNSKIISRLIEKNILEYGDVDTTYIKNKYTCVFEYKNNFYVVNLLYKTYDLIDNELFNAFICNDFESINAEQRAYYVARRYIDTHDFDYERYVNKKVSETVYLAFSYACNLNCSYCFESSNNKALFMKKEDFEKTIRYIDDISKQKKVKIVFYGGEPLLFSNIEYIEQVMSRYNDNNNIFFEFITNGTNIELAEDIITKYKRKIIKFIITLDGTKQIHDSRRMYKNGKGTFNVILDSLRKLNYKGVFVTLRINVDKENYDVQKEFLSSVDKVIKNKEMIDIEYHRVENKESMHSGIELKNMYLLVNEMKKNFSFNIIWADPIWGRLLEILENKNGYPIIQNGYCKFENMHVIDPNGTITCCNEKSGDDLFFLRNNIAEIKKMNERNECQECDMWLLCYGGCNLHYHNMRSRGCKLCHKEDFYMIMGMFIASVI